MRLARCLFTAVAAMARWAAAAAARLGRAAVAAARSITGVSSTAWGVASVCSAICPCTRNAQGCAPSPQLG